MHYCVRQWWLHWRRDAALTRGEALIQAQAAARQKVNLLTERQLLPSGAMRMNRG